MRREFSDGVPAARRYWAMLAVSCGTALAVIDGTIVTVALPSLAQDLGVRSSAAVLVVTVYQLVLVMTLLPFSALGNRIGLRRLYQYGQTLFLLATCLCLVAKTLAFLLVVRTVQALGAAASLSVSSALIRSIYPTKHLGRGLAINSVVVSSAGALAPTVGGLILSVASWPWIFVGLSPLALASLLIGRYALPSSEAQNDPYDVSGAILCAVSFGLAISGLQRALQGNGLLQSAALVGIGILLGSVFVRRELNAKTPILPVDLLSNPVLALSSIGGLLAFTGSMTVMLSLPFRLQREYGFTPPEIGMILTPWPLSIIFVGPLAGILSDRYPAAVLGGIGMVISAGGLLMMAFLPDHVSHVGLAWRMALCGVGFGLFQVPNARLIVHSAPFARAASAGGLVSTTRLTGQTLGATLLAALLSAGMGHGRIPALVAAGLALVVGLCSVARLSPVFQKAGQHK